MISLPLPFFPFYERNKIMNEKTDFEGKLKIREISGTEQVPVQNLFLRFSRYESDNGAVTSDLIDTVELVNASITRMSSCFPCHNIAFTYCVRSTPENAD